MNLKFKDMKHIFDYLLEVNDDFGMVSTTFPRTLRTVNTDEFDIVPKKSYLKRRLAEKEDELRRMEAMKESTLRYYDNRIVGIKTEIETLKGQT
jgi:hypothetical protein